MNQNKNSPITIIGIGDDGCAGLPARSVNALSRSQVLAGGERHLSFFPDFKGRKIPIRGNLSDVIAEIVDQSSEENVAVLASGDPMFFGIGSRIAKAAGAENVMVLPHPSSMQTAFSRCRIKWDDADWISLHGNKNFSFCSRLRRMNKAAIFTDKLTTPEMIAERMIEYSQTDWKGWLCENLDGPGERIRSFDSPHELQMLSEVSDLNVIVLVRKSEIRLPVREHYSEDMYAKRMPSKGLITKKEVRIQSVAMLGLSEDSIVWDVGAGSGSVSAECAMASPFGTVYAFEKNEESVLHCEENIRSFSCDNVHVISGEAPLTFSEAEDPDQVFIGGSGGQIKSILEESWKRLKPGGTMVSNAITMENIQENYEFFRAVTGEPEIIQLQVSRMAPLAKYMRYDAQNPIHIFKAVKEKQ